MSTTQTPRYLLMSEELLLKQDRKLSLPRLKNELLILKLNYIDPDHNATPLKKKLIGIPNTFTTASYIPKVIYS